MPRSRRLPAFLEADELEALLRAAKTPLHRLYFLLCVRAGLRAFEAASVRWDDLRWEESRPRYLHIPRGKGGKEAHLPIPSVLSDALREVWSSAKRGWRAPGQSNSSIGDYIFPGRRPETHIITRTAQFWMQDTAARAGLDRSKGHLHALRHSYATHLMRAGVDLMTVKQLMRHSSLSTTQIYLHVTPERLASAVDLLD